MGTGFEGEREQQDGNSKGIRGRRYCHPGDDGLLFVDRIGDGAVLRVLKEHHPLSLFTPLSDLPSRADLAASGRPPFFGKPAVRGPETFKRK